MTTQTSPDGASRPRQKPAGEKPRRAEAGPRHKPATSIIADSPLGWIAKLARRLAAHSLNMPEPVLQATGVYVFAQVQAAESRAVKTLCPFTLLRQFLARRTARRS